MYTLFWEKGSGSIVVQALLEELGAPYTRRYVDMASDEHRQAAYLATNPTGLVPALGLPDGRTIGESAAIVLHLGEQAGDNAALPCAGDPARPDFLYWLMYLASTGYPAFARCGHPERYTLEKTGIEPVQLAAEQDITELFDVLETAIGGDPWFLPGGFSALDLYLTMLAEWHPRPERLEVRNPKVGRLCAGVRQRPAYRKTMADHA